MSNGSYKFNAVQQNLQATASDINTKRWMNTRPQMCWKCQKEKQMAGGSIKFFGTVRRFICKDCVEAKQAALATTTGAQA